MRLNITLVFNIEMYLKHQIYYILRNLIICEHEFFHLAELKKSLLSFHSFPPISSRLVRDNVIPRFTGAKFLHSGEIRGQKNI